jgi:hypothetical protein
MEDFMDFTPHASPGAPPGSSPDGKIRSWAELRAVLESNRFRGWAFRGQPDASWPLQSSLYRYLSASGVREKFWRDQEKRILRIFRRKAPLHLQHVPQPRDSFQWLALMQHHGAPTRLIDFTWSPYVAAFYALSDPLAIGAEAAIWAVNQSALNRHAEKLGPWYLGNFEKYFLPGNRQLVLIGEPHHMNQRLTTHAATFLISGQIHGAVEALVQKMDPDAVQKITVVTEGVRREALKALYSINITHATLFPGLDGLAQSMRNELELHWARDLVTEEEYFPEKESGARRFFAGLHRLFPRKQRPPAPGPRDKGPTPPA